MKNAQKTKEALLAFGFSEKEICVFFALLKHGSSRITDLAKDTGLPRTTLYPIINRLLAHELVSRIKIRKHFEYECSDLDALARMLDEHVKELKEEIPLLQSLLNEERVRSHYSIELHTTKTGFRAAYKMILDLPSGERAYFIEGTGSARQKLSHLHTETIVAWQSAFKKKGVILEAVCSQTTIKLIQATNPEVKRAHTGRLVIGYILPDDALNFDTDIFCFKDFLVITVMRRDVAMIIRGREVAETFKILFSILTRLGKKVDLNNYFS